MDITTVADESLVDKVILMAEDMGAMEVRGENVDNIKEQISIGRDEILKRIIS